jgi:hypothetical protein
MIKKIISIFKKDKPKEKKELTLFEQWEEARNNFQHYAIRVIYDNGDGFRRTVSSEERKYCIDMANRWEIIIEKLEDKIQNNLKK